MQRLLLLLWLCAAVQLPAQVFESHFPSRSLLYKVIPSADGNFVAIGAKGLDAATMKVWLVKFNPAGQMIWEKTYLPAGASAQGHSVTEAADGGFLITGGYGSSSSIYYDGSFVMKTAPQGSPVWSKTLSGTLYTSAQTADGQWLIGGNTDNNYNGNATVYRLNANGNILWQHEYPAYAYRGHIMQILPQADGSFYAAGRGEVTGLGFQGVFLVKATGIGDTIWQRAWDTGNYNQDLFLNQIDPLGAVQASNGDILIADGSRNGKALLLRYNPQGNKIWEQYYGGSADYGNITALAQDASGNLYLAGSKAGAASQNRYNFLLKTNAAGVEQWSRNYPFSGINLLTGVALRTDGSCMVCGQSKKALNLSAYLAGFDTEGYRDPRSIAVNLRRDVDGNCSPSPGDVPLKGWNIRLTGNNNTFILTTDDFGNAQQRVPDDDYQLETVPISPLWSPCQSNPQSISVNANGGPVFSIDLMAKPDADCPVLSVSITSPDLVRCEESIYYVECQNLGTSIAQNARVDVKTEDLLSLQDASMPFLAGGGQYSFLLGDIPPLASKRFWMKMRLSCDATIGQTHCVEVEAFPKAACALPPGPNWSGASLRLKADCTGGTIHFTAQNTGNGDMSVPVPYQIFVDGWRLQTGEIQLDAGQDWSVDYPANGRSVWMEAEQVQDHPGEDRPGAGWEGCGVTGNGFASTGFLDMFEHNGRDPQKSYGCVENTRIALPDRVVGIPEGYGWYHLLSFDAKPEYVLRFKNPLPQAAHNIKARVQLSPFLDASTFAVTASSHPYTVKSVEAGTFDIMLDNVSLPTIGQDPLMSQAFLRFKADLDPTVLDTGARILIDAQAYFGGEGSSTLNTAYHFTVPKDFGITDQPSPYSDASGMTVFPGSSQIDFCEDVVQNPDGTMFLLTTTYSYGSNHDLVLIKTDQNGRGIWQKVYDFDGGDVFYYAVSDGAGGLVATGYQDDPAIPDNYFNDSYLPIVRIDADGNVLWYRREKPGTGDSGKGGNAYGIIRSADGNFVVTGALMNGPTNIDNFLLKINPAGQTLWFQNYLVTDVALNPKGVRQTQDGGYIMAGNNESDWPNSVMFQKVNAAGITEWAVTHPFVSDETPNGMSGFDLTPDGGYVWLGYLSTYDADSNYVYWPTITRLDAQGGFLWRKTLELGIIVYPGPILANSDGGYVFTGEILPDANAPFTKLLMAATDADANLLWSKTYDANTRTNGQFLHPRPNGGYVVTGQTQTSNFLYNLAGVLLLTDSVGVLGTKQAPAATAPQLVTWPNPAQQFFNVRIVEKQAKGPFSWQLFDVEGKLIQEGESMQSSFRVETAQQALGVYQLSVRWKGGWATKSVVLGGH